MARRGRGAARARPRGGPRPRRPGGSPSAPSEIARLITAENGKPLKWARGRGRPGGVDVPLGRRGGPPLLRRAAAARHRPRRDRADRAGHAGCRAGRCSASRRSTSRSTWSRTRSPRRSRSARRSCVKPAPGDAADRAAARRDPGRDRPARRHVLGAAAAQRPRRRRWSPTRGCRWCRSPAPGRSAAQIRARRAAQARHAGARRQRRGRGLRGLAADATSTGPRRASRTFANYQAGQSCIAVQRVIVHDRRCRRASCAALVAAVEALRDRRPVRRADRRRAADQRGRRRAGRVLGRRGRRRRREAARPAASATAPTYAPTVLTGVPADAKVVRRGGLRPGAGAAAGRRRRGRVRRGQRLGVRPAGRRVHPPTCDRPSRAHRDAGGRRRDHRRRAVATAPTRCPTAASRARGVGREGLRRAMDDYTEREGHGADRPRSLAGPAG